MKSKNLIILSVWTAVTIIFVVLSILGVAYTTTVQPTQWLLWMFNDWWVVFIIGLIFTGGIVFFMKEPEVELQKELSNIRSKIDILTEKVDEIKKTIEE
jgi:peptidoglycan hydrolase CwlO-like protein